VNNKTHYQVVAFPFLVYCMYVSGKLVCVFYTVTCNSHKDDFITVAITKDRNYL